MSEAPDPAYAVLFAYAGLALGDFSSGALSQYLRTRKKVLFGYLVLTAVFIACYFTIAARSLTTFFRRKKEPTASRTTARIAPAATAIAKVVFIRPPKKPGGRHTGVATR